MLPYTCFGGFFFYKMGSRIHLLNTSMVDAQAYSPYLSKRPVFLDGHYLVIEEQAAMRIAMQASV